MRYTDADVHPSAVVSPSARIGKGCAIGPGVTIGANVTIGNLCTIGSRPEHRSFLNSGQRPAGVRVEDGAMLGDMVVVSQGCERATIVGRNVFLMSHVTVGHDAMVFENATVASGVKIGGHALIGPYANLGLNAAVHQRSQVGFGAMVGMLTAVRGEVGAFQTVSGNPARIIGMNKFLMSQLNLNLPAKFIASQELTELLLDHPDLLRMASEMLRVKS